MKRLTTVLLWLAILGTGYWMYASNESILAKNNELEDANQTIQTLNENNDAAARRISELEQIVDTNVFFITDYEWDAAPVPIYDLALSKELQEYTYNLCYEYGISEYYEMVLAVMWQESNFVDSVVSVTDDYGLMQINKINHQWLSTELGISDFLDPLQNIRAGIHILASLLIKYEDPHKALMAYNMGEAGASSFWKAGIYSSSYSISIYNKQQSILN